MLDQPGDTGYIVLMVLGVAALYVAAFQLWQGQFGTVTPAWRPWVLLVVAAGVLLFAVANL